MIDNTDYAQLFVQHSESIIQRYHLEPFIEFVMSRVAHHIFSQNFPKYSLFYQKDGEAAQMITVGYIRESTQKDVCHTASLVRPENIYSISFYLNLEARTPVQCDEVLLAGAENVYAASFYLGLEVRTPVQELNGNLYIDDFSHPLHSISKEDKCLITEYRDHKIYFSEVGTLFPQSFINNNCANWFGGKECDVNKLRASYKAIADTPNLELQNIVDNVVNIFAAVGMDYQEVGELMKPILIGNADIIRELLQSEG